MSAYSPALVVLAALVAAIGALLVGAWIWRRLAPPLPRRTTRVYISWDRAGRAARDRLVTALRPEVDAGRMVLHHDREVRRGGQWDRRLHPRLHDADLYIILLTPGWLRDPLCRGRERPIWQPRVRRGLARVLLLHLHATDLRDPELLALPRHPPDGHPLTRPGRALAAAGWAALVPRVREAAGWDSPA